MERWQNKVAVITGASSGIGAAIAKEFVMAGLKVIGLARRTHLMEEEKMSLPLDKRSQYTAMYCDISNPKSVDEAFDLIISQYGGVDVLVNNAGIGQTDQLSTMNLDDARKIMNTNVMGVVHCTQRAFKSMSDRHFDGHIIMVNSIAGHSVFVGIPLRLPITNIYSPCKFALTALTELYRQEFSGLGTKIKISSISPGVVDTDILLKDLRAAAGDCMIQPHDVSKAVLFMLATPPHVQIHEMIIKPLGELV
ncbi:farnesol dehydrogenase-like [Haematobia irritans]|uniref:farnesol dehydrogenase-like n=1 Tax=Haematobia irritans TaxID=7368 RepID=UPI003F4F5708